MFVLLLDDMVCLFLIFLKKSLVICLCVLIGFAKTVRFSLAVGKRDLN